MGEAIEELAHFIAGTPWEAIPTAVREHAKLVLLDTLGVILAGSVQPEVAAVRARLTATGGHGATIYAPGCADVGSAHGGVSQRTGRPLDRAVRRPSLRLLSGRRAGVADGAGLSPNGSNDPAARRWPRSSSATRSRPDLVRD